MRLNHKLVSAFFAVAVLIGISGYLSSSELAIISSAYYRQTDEEIPALSSLNDMKSTLPIIELEPSEYLNEPDSEHIEELEEAKQVMDAALLTYEKLGGYERVIGMRQQVDELFALAYQIISLRDEGASKEILQQHFNILDDKLDIFDEAIDAEKDRITKELKATSESLKSDIQYTWDLTIMLTVIASGISLAAALYISNAVSKPITKLKEAADQIGKGNFNVETRFSKSSDEIGELCMNFEKMKNELRNKEAMQKEFINIASHELRTPIQPILGISELVKRGLIKQEDAWDKVLSEARRLQKLANDILDVTKIESGGLICNTRKVRVNDLITEVLESAQMAKGPQASEIVMESELDDDIELSLDKSRVAQALANIVDNAMKFTKEGRIKIKTCTLPHKKLFEIKISDTGIGIPDEILPKLFGKFVTKTSGDDINKHGTGLGLFIAKSIIQAHGGEIFAYNNEGSGATFVIRLPFK